MRIGDAVAKVERELVCAAFISYATRSGWGGAGLWGVVGIADEGFLCLGSCEGVRKGRECGGGEEGGGGG